jgi:hypothetical protein
MAMAVTTTFHTSVPTTSIPIEYGLDIILSHLEEPHFPRRISTYITEKNSPWQVSVNSRDEALAMFKQSDLIDCRISAYPCPVPEDNRGINMQAPNFFLTDLDKKNFKSDRLFQQCLEDTLKNFKDKLHGANPTVLWSGGGYHLLQPLDADIVLETQSIFAKFNEPSRKLMSYAENLMTYGKADPVHRGTVSFGNCMIRIPGSYNAKYIQFDEKDEVVNIPTQSEVKIVQPWDGYRPNIRWLLEDYWVYLIQERTNEKLAILRDDKKRVRLEIKYPNRCRRQTSGKIDWIESLYAKPLDDFREYCITFVFAPYFINIKGLPQSEAFNLIKGWLDRCSFLRRLDFNARQRIDYALKTVRRYRPISLHKLKLEMPLLYTRLRNEGIAN